MLKKSALGFFSIALAISSCDRIGDALGDRDKDADRPIERESSGEIPDHLACVDEGRPDFNPEPLQHPARPRKVRPTAGALADATIADHSRFQAAAYDMYRAFDAGEDPRSAFPDDDLNLEALIYGEPGPQTERPRAPARSRTLYGFVAATPDGSARYIVFRGTMQTVEWVRNIQALPVSFAIGGDDAQTVDVHKGFAAIFETFEVEYQEAETRSLAEAIDSGLLDAPEIYVVGHSLGGALASLTAVDAAARAPDAAARIHLISLASPRVGDADFAARGGALGSARRVCNLVDIVPTVPFSTKAFTYVHIGDVVKVSSFDHEAALNNDVEKAGDQVLCWHGIDAYDYLLGLGKPAGANPTCFK